MASPGHCFNIMNPGIKQMGVAKRRILGTGPGFSQRKQFESQGQSKIIRQLQKYTIDYSANNYHDLYELYQDDLNNSP